MRTFCKSPKKPSKYCSRLFLERVLLDNCQTDSGIEYNEYELKELILQKQMREANEMIEDFEKQQKERR